MSGKVFAPSVDLGADFERAPGGFVDYVLLNTDGRAVAVLEAKKESIDPLTAKEQARAYAVKLAMLTEPPLRVPGHFAPLLGAWLRNLNCEVGSGFICA